MFCLPEKIEYIINTLFENGFEAYAVGGCVRDMLLGVAPKDYDIATNATPDAIIALFPKTVPTGIKHGTVTVIVSGEPVEVTTYRTENGYADSRHPDKVNFVADIKEDLSRRDFTVNAMAYNKNSGLVDLFGGEKDLKSKILRAVGNPEIRFKEDSLRILRLFRFASVLGFGIEKSTEKAALSLADTLAALSSERIASELTKAVLGDNLDAFTPFINCGGLEFLGVIKNPDYTLLSKLSKKPELRLFAFLYLSDADSVTAAEKLKLSGRYKKYFDCFIKFTKISRHSKQGLKQMLAVADKPDTVFDFLEFARAFYSDTFEPYELLKAILSNGEPYLTSHLKISGEDLINLGFSGKRIGEIMKILLEEAVENPNINTNENLIGIAKNL